MYDPLPIPTRDPILSPLESTHQMTSQDITHALFLRYNNPDHYIPIAEFRPGTGYGINSERFIDFYLIDCYQNCLTTAFEIKVSRNDFLNELNNPEKRRLALHFSHQFFFVTPKDLIQPHELPPEAGLIEATQTPQGIQLRQVRPALHRESARPTWRFVASIARQLHKAAQQSIQAAKQVPLAQRSVTTQLRALARN